MNGFTPDADGSLWGIAQHGGADHRGGIFRIAPDGSFEWRASFTIGTGWGVTGRLLLGKNGLFYGTTFEGSHFNIGNVYSFDPVTNRIATVHDFDGPHGANGTSELVQDESGALYGVSYRGGKNGLGVVFKLVP